MSNALIASFEVGGNLVELDGDTVKKYLVNGNGKVTDQEVAMFINLCKYQGLNPFVREAYLIKYGDAPATTVVGKDAFTRRASQIEECNGWSAGIAVINTKGVYEEREGTIVLPKETLVGGWCDIERKGWNRPFKATVSLSEYNTGKSMWAKMPATMIRKVALVQALREAFPDKFQGMYDQSEIGVNETLPEVEVVVDKDTKNEPLTNAQKMAINELLNADENRIRIAKSVLNDYDYGSLREIKQGDFENIMEDLKNAFAEKETVIDVEPEELVFFDETDMPEVVGEQYGQI